LSPVLMGWSCELIVRRRCRQGHDYDVLRR
jgi:hypothetical protein